MPSCFHLIWIRLTCMVTQNTSSCLVSTFYFFIKLVLKKKWVSVTVQGCVLFFLLVLFVYLFLLFILNLFRKTKINAPFEDCFQHWFHSWVLLPRVILSDWSVCKFNEAFSGLTVSSYLWGLHHSCPIVAKCAFTPWQELYQKWIKLAILIDVWQTLQSGLCLSGSCKKKLSLVGVDLTENFGSCHMTDNSLKKGKSSPFHILHIAEWCDSALPLLAQQIACRSPATEPHPTTQHKPSTITFWKGDWILCYTTWLISFIDTP